MSEEENKAIEILTSYKNQLKDRKPFNCSFLDMQWAIGVILDLYNKEKEKNKELQDDLSFRVNYCKKLEQELYGGEFDETLVEQKHFISKDKIRAKIKELENKQNETHEIYMYANEIKILKELLEE